MAIGVGIAVPLELQPNGGNNPTSGILLETGDFLLLENGDFLIQET